MVLLSRHLNQNHGDFDMDFNEFNSRKKADEARPLHVKHPVTGDPLHNADGTPCLVYVYGVEGAVGQRAARDFNAKERLPEKAIADDMHVRLTEHAAKLIAGFEGIFCGDRELGNNPDDIQWFLNLQMINPAVNEGRGLSFTEQVLRFHGDRTAYLGKLVKPSSLPPSN